MPNATPANIAYWQAGGSQFGANGQSLYRPTGGAMPSLASGYQFPSGNPSIGPSALSAPSVGGSSGPGGSYPYSSTTGSNTGAGSTNFSQSQYSVPGLGGAYANLLGGVEAGYGQLLGQGEGLVGNYGAFQQAMLARNYDQLDAVAKANAGNTGANNSVLQSQLQSNMLNRTLAQQGLGESTTRLGLGVLGQFGLPGAQAAQSFAQQYENQLGQQGIQSNTGNQQQLQNQSGFTTYPTAYGRGVGGGGGIIPGTLGSGGGGSAPRGGGLGGQYSTPTTGEQLTMPGGPGTPLPGIPGANIPGALYGGMGGSGAYGGGLGSMYDPSAAYFGGDFGGGYNPQYDPNFTGVTGGGVDSGSFTPSDFGGDF